MVKDYSVRRVRDALNATLWGYLEAQYHIRDEGLIAERELLLREPEGVTQKPYIEATPVYESASVPPYPAQDLPEAARDLLSTLASYNVGIFEPPYRHQADALKAFLTDGHDLIVATGTGSGKTESFLMPILGSLAVEGAERPESWNLPGIRALLLYPMNALVADQLARIRRLFGDERVKQRLRQGRERPVQFGMYTSRTPYPGKKSGTRDARYIQPVFEEFYLQRDETKAINDPDAFAERAELRDRWLKPKGRWPCKDLVPFFAAEKITKKVQKGKERTYQNFAQRLLTQPDDAELYTRHEMLARSPDLLITNYSMLEYMLLRPIERRLFDETRRWLEKDERNHFILVLDEAHTYRGAAGAEVALLIRRLQARLGISRERFRCILTSASLGGRQEDREAVRRFACDLSGLADEDRLTLITGQREVRSVTTSTRPTDAPALAGFRLGDFHQHAVEPERAHAAVAELAVALKWVPPAEGTNLPQYLFDRVTGWQPVEDLIKIVSGQATEYGDLVGRLFPGLPAETGEPATETLLALATFAKRHDRVLMPTRLHLLFRGLPGLFACANQSCCKRRATVPPAGRFLLGRLHTQPVTTCGCGGRVYELLTHRECGAAFLRGYVRGTDGNFVWHEPSGLVGQKLGDALWPVQLLVEDPHKKAIDEGLAVEAWLEPLSGHLQMTPPAEPDRFLRCWKVAADKSANPRALDFPSCPVCLKRWKKGRSKIMDLVTKGEAPFAGLVRTQLLIQPPRKEATADAPNAGRKVLLFSDGRQKAARLARDIPREVELDSFRQAIALAARDLKNLKDPKNLRKEPRISDRLYLAFLAVAERFHLAFFDGYDQYLLRRDCRRFREDFGSDLEHALEDWGDVKPPIAYRVALLRQLCRPFYSIPAVTVGYLPPFANTLTNLEREAKGMGLSVNRNTLESIVVAWADELRDEFALNKDLSKSVRAEAAGYWQKDWSESADFTPELQQILQQVAGMQIGQIRKLQEKLADRLAERPSEGKGHMLKPDEFLLCIDLARSWFRCAACTRIGPVAPFGRCPYCASDKIKECHPDKDAYLQKRMGHWRDPVRRVLDGAEVPAHVTAEEHTAQLSQRDAGVVQATTERYELRFQDIILSDRDGPIDVLSCTTTMEVGVDIGELVAVGLRNMPPQRENYQQRAGRAGRRGSAVSTVVTYGQNGPHDSYYFHNPKDIVSGPPRRPMVKIDNEKIARRHVHAYLIQTFFHETIEATETEKTKAKKAKKGQTKTKKAGLSGSLFDALGTTRDFFGSDEGNAFSLACFRTWLEARILAAGGDLTSQIAAWLPDVIAKDKPAWIRQTTREFLVTLDLYAKELSGKDHTADGDEEDAENDAEEGEEMGTAGSGEDEERQAAREVAAAQDAEKLQDAEGRLLLNFLFDRSLLPTYAFPTDLCSFLVEKWVKRGRGAKRYFDLVVKERPQLGIAQALSEYAPGRLLVIDKLTYRSGGVTASASPTTVDRAAPLFTAQKDRRYIFCPVCNFVREPAGPDAARVEHCPLCHAPGELQTAQVITPQIFTPEEGEDLGTFDRDQDYTQATSAQFPVPLDAQDLGDWKALTLQANYTYATDRQLVVVNKGDGLLKMGFHVCEKCGFARVYDPNNLPKGRHPRPYKVKRLPGHDVPEECSGTFRQVFLGHQFLSDLMLLRIPIQSPFADNLRASDIEQSQGAAKVPGTSVVLHALNDALRTLAEGLLLAASRRLQIDPVEFSTGYRLLPKEGGLPLRGELYLFDTLAGGAGYAAQAGGELLDILRDNLAPLLRRCPNNDCDRSCYECLRHYNNQIYHESLDRELAAGLLDYVLDGTVPTRSDLARQARRLFSLQRMLELEGLSCQSRVMHQGLEVPLLVQPRPGQFLAIGTYHGLLDEKASHGFDHPLYEIERPGGTHVKLLNAYLLGRNLPAARQEVQEILDQM